MNEKSPGAAPPKTTREGQRIAKVMARAGLCSRRDAEVWIRDGRVSVNGKVLDSPAFNVNAGDDVRVDGQRLQEAERTRLFLFHKPRGLVTTARDPEGRPTIFDALPEDLPRVVAVGRLDINTEGLILLTNDGGLARVLELPATAWLRRYRVRAHGAIDQAQLDALREGVTIEGIHYAGIEARLEREQGSNVWIMMGLREGKNREIKRVLEHLGLSVNRLIRVSFGPFELGDLAEGEVAEVRTRVLRDQLGAKLAKEAGVDFDAEIVDHAVPPPPPSPAAPRRGERSARPRPGGRERPERESFGAKPPARRSEPEPSRAPRQRKHVTALRAEAATETGGPRRRIERGATSDRKGREIKVERLVATGEELRRRTADAVRRDQRKSAGRPSRGAGEGEGRRGPHGEGRSFEKRTSSGEGRSAPRGEGRSFEKRSPSGESRPPRGEGRPFEKRAFSGEGRSFDKRASSGEGRPPRGEGRPFEKRGPSGEGRPPRGEGRSFEKRGPSGEGRPPRGEGRTFEKRASSGEGRSAPRGEGRSFEKRGPSGEGRPPRGEGRPFEKRASSSEGRPPRAGGKPPGKRGPASAAGRPPPRGGKPGGKSGGKPGGARPPRRP